MSVLSRGEGLGVGKDRVEEKNVKNRDMNGKT